jgi:hypothetical protein
MTQKALAKIVSEVERTGVVQNAIEACAVRSSISTWLSLQTGTFDLRTR